MTIEPGDTGSIKIEQVRAAIEQRQSTGRSKGAGA